jgi:uncharacterized protein
MVSKRRFFIWFLILAWIGIGSLLSMIVDWQWFDSVGYLDFFKTKLSMQIGLWLMFFVLSFGYVFWQIGVAAKSDRFKWMYIEDHFEIEMSEESWNSVFKAVHYGLSILPAISFANFASDQWLRGLALLDPVSFDKIDPIFGLDFGFYVFQLPMINFISNWALFIVFITMLITAVQHLMRDVFFGAGEGVTEWARRHLLLQGSFYFVLLSIDWILDRYEVLFSQGQGLVWGAGYADLNARIPSFWIMSAVALFVAGLLFRLRTNPSKVSAVSGIFGYFFLYAVCVWVWPELIQNFMVTPNEIEYERPYLEHNIETTKWAYGLDRIQVKPFEVDEELDWEAIQDNPLTINNIRIWDDRPLLTTYGQLQEIRTYYDFYDVDIDRYIIDGELRQVMLSGRELNYGNVSTQAQSWINAHFQYTHGYGLTMSPVNQVSKEGQPSLFIKDIPPQSSIDMDVSRPEIYFGELTNQYVVVNSDVEEFDYPQGDENVYTKYQGVQGVSLGSFMQRLLYAWYFGDVEMILSNYMLPESRLLYRRNIVSRVKMLAPYLVFDSDPYMVLSEGKLIWMIDAYTTTEDIPYSEPYPGRRFNYIRNSVKVIVDAYEGSVDFYVADTSDPLVQFYQSSFSTVFKSMDAFPDDLRSHIRYPEDFFDVQAWMYRSYHMNDVTVFYNKEDMWSLPTELYNGKERRMESYYLIMKLPQEDAAEFVLLLPFVPQGKDNMISWLAARSDGEEYGNLILYQFPKQKMIYGPRQIESRIDQDPEISKQITLWSQSGSAVVRGNLLVIPIEDSLMYVEPLYLQAESSQMPELKRVIVAYENTIIMREDLSTALREVFGADLPSTVSEFQRTLPQEKSVNQNGVISDVSNGSVSESVLEANRLFESALEAQRQGNWARYGEQVQQLGMLLKQLSVKPQGVMEQAEEAIQDSEIEALKEPVLDTP